MATALTALLVMVIGSVILFTFVTLFVGCVVYGWPLRVWAQRFSHDFLGRR